LAGERAAELEGRAAAGDPDAQFRHGLALLSGETAGTEGPRAIASIESAADQGHPEALAKCALFEAMGAGRTQNWEKALDRLQQAAEAGSQSARGQILALARQGSDENDWAGMRARISVETLLEAPPRRMLSDAPRIVSFDGFATEAECSWIIERTRDRLQRAKVFSTATGDQTYDKVRDNKAIEFQLPQMDLVLEVVRARISTATRLPVQIFEPTQVLHYSVGEQFRPHHDFLDPEVPQFADYIRQFGQRIGTLLIYLNEGFSGGETAFPRLGLNYRGRTGDALFFTNVDRSGRPDRMTMHAGTPPTAGEKWVLSQWIRDRAPAPFAAGAIAP